MPSGTPKRVAVVTGAAGGLGWATAQRLATDGFVVVCVGRGDNVAARAAELRAGGADADSEIVDVADTDAAVASVAAIAQRHQRLDVLINNAGGALHSAAGTPLSVEETSIDAWARIIALNLTAPFILSREAMPHMKRNRWGRIVNVSSRAGRTGIEAADTPYSAAKAGVLGLTRHLAMRFAKHNITVNAIAAGRFGTDKANAMEQSLVAAAVASIPVGRAGFPDEFAATVSFLVSDGAAYMTGATLDVNGGAFMA
jgi:3-oxoacyl-[acyl-carrier protein] reductase